MPLHFLFSLWAQMQAEHCWGSSPHKAYVTHERVRGKDTSHTAAGYTLAHMRTHKHHSYLHACPHTHIHTHKHSYTQHRHAYAHARRHAHMRHTYTHTHLLSYSRINRRTHA